MSKWENLVFFLCITYPKLARTLRVKAVAKSVSDFYYKVVQLLIEMKDVTLEEITAQSFVFFLAAFETSSSTMSWAMYELAKNPHIQQKVRDEINRVVARCGGKLTYEGIQEMKYLGQVVDGKN